jgi:hypothetical protein
MSRPTHCIIITLASLAIAAPAASAMVVDPLPTSGTSAPAQDLRNPDQRVPAQVADLSTSGTSAPAQDLRNPDQRVPAQVADLHASTAVAAQHAQAGTPKSPDDDGISPLVFVLPSAALLAALGAATGFAVSTGRFPRSHARV